MTFLNRLIISVLSCCLIACSASPQLEANAVAPEINLPEGETTSLIVQYDDPFEGFNRRMYYFNAVFDDYVMLPIVDVYQFITPDIIETGVSNVFSNLNEITTFVNAILQGKFNVAGQTLGRFTLNSTLGIAGLFDVATAADIAKQNEDFGQTLGHWGLAPGPYIVLPLLGPSSFRDMTGLAFDALAYQQAINELGMEYNEELMFSFIKAIDARATLPFRYYMTGSAFEYEQLKLLYMRYREIVIAR